MSRSDPPTTSTPFGIGFGGCGCVLFAGSLSEVVLKRCNKEGHTVLSKCLPLAQLSMNMNRGIWVDMGICPPTIFSWGSPNKQATIAKWGGLGGGRGCFERHVDSSPPGFCGFLVSNERPGGVQGPAQKAQGDGGEGEDAAEDEGLLQLPRRTERGFLKKPELGSWTPEAEACFYIYFFSGGRTGSLTVALLVEQRGQSQGCGLKRAARTSWFQGETLCQGPSRDKNIGNLG